MPDRTGHERCVDAWLAANVEAERDPRRVLDTVAEAMRAMRVRSGASMGEGAASVVFERLVANATGALDGLSLDAACNAPCELERDDVLAASRALLLETLTVLSSLTGDALTSALHEELTATAPPRPAPPPPRSGRKRRAPS